MCCNHTSGYIGPVFPPTARPEKIRRMAAAYRARLEKLRAKVADLGEEIARLEEWIAFAEAQATRLEGKMTTLRTHGQADTVSTDMHLAPDVRARKNLKISRAKRGNDPFLAALAKRSWTLRQYAQHLGVPVSTMGSWRHKPPHGRPIPRAIAERIERELEFRATAANWPNGISQ